MAVGSDSDSAEDEEEAPPAPVRRERRASTLHDPTEASRRRTESTHVRRNTRTRTIGCPNEAGREASGIQRQSLLNNDVMASLLQRRRSCAATTVEAAAASAAASSVAATETRGRRRTDVARLDLVPERVIVHTAANSPRCSSSSSSSSSSSTSSGATNLTGRRTALSLAASRRASRASTLHNPTEASRLREEVTFRWGSSPHGLSVPRVNRRRSSVWGFEASDYDRLIKFMGPEGQAVRRQSNAFKSTRSQNMVSVLSQDCVRQVRLLQECSEEFVDLLMECMESRIYKDGSDILHEGDPGNFLFLLIRGNVEVLVGDTQVAELGDGSVFGEMALLGETGGRRSATVRATAFCDCRVVSKDALALALRSHPRNKGALVAQARRRAVELGRRGLDRWLRPPSEFGNPRARSRRNLGRLKTTGCLNEHVAVVRSTTATGGAGSTSNGSLVLPAQPEPRRRSSAIGCEACDSRRRSCTSPFQGEATCTCCARVKQSEEERSSVSSSPAPTGGIRRFDTMPAPLPARRSSMLQVPGTGALACSPVVRPPSQSSASSREDLDSSEDGESEEEQGQRNGEPGVGEGDTVKRASQNVNEAQEERASMIVDSVTIPQDGVQETERARQGESHDRKREGEKTEAAGSASRQPSVQIDLSPHLQAASANEGEGMTQITLERASELVDPSGSSEHEEEQQQEEAQEYLEHAYTEPGTSSESEQEQSAARWEQAAPQERLVERPSPTCLPGSPVHSSTGAQQPPTPDAATMAVLPPPASTMPFRSVSSPHPPEPQQSAICGSEAPSRLAEDSLQEPVMESSSATLHAEAAPLEPRTQTSPECLPARPDASAQGCELRPVSAVEAADAAERPPSQLEPPPVAAHHQPLQAEPVSSGPQKPGCGQPAEGAASSAHAADQGRGSDTARSGRGQALQGVLGPPRQLPAEMDPLLAEMPPVGHRKTPRSADDHLPANSPQKLRQRLAHLEGIVPPNWLSCMPCPRQRHAALAALPPPPSQQQRHRRSRRRSGQATVGAGGAAGAVKTTARPSRRPPEQCEQSPMQPRNTGGGSRLATTRPQSQPQPPSQPLAAGLATGSPRKATPGGQLGGSPRKKPQGGGVAGSRSSRSPAAPAPSSMQAQQPLSAEPPPTELPGPELPHLVPRPTGAAGEAEPSAAGRFPLEALVSAVKHFGASEPRGQSWAGPAHFSPTALGSAAATAAAAPVGALGSGSTSARARGNVLRVQKAL